MRIVGIGLLAGVSVGLRRDQAHGRVVHPLLAGMLVRGDVPLRLAFSSRHDRPWGAGHRTGLPMPHGMPRRIIPSFGGSRRAIKHRDSARRRFVIPRKAGAWSPMTIDCLRGKPTRPPRAAATSSPRNPVMMKRRWDGYRGSEPEKPGAAPCSSARFGAPREQCADLRQGAGGVSRFIGPRPPRMSGRVTVPTPSPGHPSPRTVLSANSKHMSEAVPPRWSALSPSASTRPTGKTDRPRQ